VSDLELIRWFPKEGDRTPTARAKLSPNLTNSGIRRVGKFEPEIQISGPPAVGPWLGFILSITRFCPSAVPSSLAVITVWRHWWDGIRASARDAGWRLSIGGTGFSLVPDGMLLVGPLESPEESSSGPEDTVLCGTGFPARPTCPKRVLGRLLGGGAASPTVSASSPWFLVCGGSLVTILKV